MEATRRRRWLVPVVVGVILAGATVATAKYIHHRLDLTVEREAERLARRQALHLEDFVDARLEALEQMRIDVEDGSVPPGDERAFEPRADMVQASLPG